VANISLMMKRLKRRCGSGRGFRRTAKAMGQVYQCWWRICREIDAFTPPPRFEYHMFYVLYPFVTYVLTLPCISQDNQSPDLGINPRRRNSKSSRPATVTLWSATSDALQPGRGLAQFRGTCRSDVQSRPVF
jgi:hypothetical protein